MRGQYLLCPANLAPCDLPEEPDALVSPPFRAADRLLRIILADEAGARYVRNAVLDQTLTDAPARLLAAWSRHLFAFPAHEITVSG